MTQRELIYIKTVADEKSISKAAKKLFIAQPSLSQYVKRIEDGLNTPLFNRTPAGLTLTYAGERYYHMASQILKMVESFEMEVSDINDMKTGRIHVGIPNHLGAVLLPKILPRFSALCPSIEIHITEETSLALERLLMSGKLDFLIMHAPKEQENPALCYEFLSRDPFLIVTSKNHPVSLQAACAERGGYALLDIRALSQERLITLPAGQRIREVTNSILKEAEINRPDIYLTVKNFATAQLLAASGLGYTLIPSQYLHITSMDIAPACYAIPKQYKAYWDLCITTLKDSFLSKADLLFLQILKELYPQDVRYS